MSDWRQRRLERRLRMLAARVRWIEEMERLIIMDAVRALMAIGSSKAEPDKTRT